MQAHLPSIHMSTHVYVHRSVLLSIYMSMPCARSTAAALHACMHVYACMRARVRARTHTTHAQTHTLTIPRNNRTVVCMHDCACDAYTTVYMHCDMGVRGTNLTEVVNRGWVSRKEQYATRAHMHARSLACTHNRMYHTRTQGDCWLGGYLAFEPGWA